jgi:DNA-binding NtrC family response regulator
MRRPTILIAEAAGDLHQKLRTLLSPNGYRIIEANGKDKILETLQKDKPDLVLVYSLQKLTRGGLKITKCIRRRNQKIPIVLITEHSTEERAIAALRVGVNDYFKMPFSNHALSATIKRNLPTPAINTAAVSGSEPACVFFSHPMVGESRHMREIKDYLSRVAATDSTVLITGETGTGKELAATMIHQLGPRNSKPYICVNCASLPDTLVESELFGYSKGAFTGAVAEKMGKFEMACGGSVFLDEIGDMSPYTQAKILRSIELKEVYPLGGKAAVPLDVRVIAATNQNPEQLIEEGKFREDLYYRLNVARVHMPPLKDRKEDIPKLIEHAIQILNRRFKRNIQGLTDDAMAILLRYDWPGNVRELLNLMEAAYINLSQRKIKYADLPKQFKEKLKQSEKLPKDERRYIISALLDTNWNKSTAAQKLHWSRMTLYRKMAKYNIVEKRSRVKPS